MDYNIPMTIEKTLLNEYIPLWLNSLKSKETRKNYKYYINYFLKNFNLNSISNLEIENFFSDINNNTNFSLLNQKKVASSLFNFLERMTSFTNPLKKINFSVSNNNVIDILKIRRRALNNELCNKIILQLKSDKNETSNYSNELLIFICLLNSGMRVSELLSLELYSPIKDKNEQSYYNYLRLEGDRFFVLIKGKGGKFRYFFLNKNITTFLQEFPLKEGEPIFKNQKGNRLTRYGVYYYFEKIKKNYLTNDNIYKFSPHSLRHTYCTEMSKRNESPINVAKTVGNSVDMIEKVYYQNIKDINKDYYIL